MPMRAVLRCALGDMRLTLIDDGSFEMPLTMFTSEAPEGMAEAMLADYGLPTERARIPLAVMLVETEGIRGLVDTGLGDIALTARAF